MSDLSGGHYPQYWGLQALFGGLTNVANPSVPPRSNAEWLGIGDIADGAVAGSGIICAVPVPVDIGTTVSAISILVGATAASVPTHSWGALYSGIATPALIGQSTDGSTAAIAASAAFKFTLTTPQNITAAQAPGGWVYAAFSITATTVNTAIVSNATPSGVQYAYFTNSPAYLSLTSGSSVGATATATLASPSVKTVAPLVVLT